MGNFKSFYKNERGDALTPTLILSAVALTVLMGLGYSLISLVKMQRGAALSDDRIDVREQLLASLSLRRTCLSAITGAGSQSVPPGNTLTNLKLRMFMSGADRLLEPNSEAAPGLTVSSLQFKRTAAPQASTTIDPLGDGSAVSGTVLTGTIVIGLKKTNASLFARDYKTDEIPIVIAVGGGGNVIACSTQGSDSSACKEMPNTIWSPLGTPGEQCRRIEQCDLGGGYCNAPVSKGGFTNPATGLYTCPAGYKARQKGVVTYSTECGKSCINTEMYPVVECAKCRGLGGDVMPDVSIPSYGSVGINLGGSDTENQLTALGNFFAGLGIFF